LSPLDRVMEPEPSSVQTRPASRMNPFGRYA
jgi:hypothetical protein